MLCEVGMGGTGLEPTPLALSKTPISGNVRTESGTRDAPNTPKNDPALQKIIEAWPGLPEQTKRQILELVVISD